MGNVKFIGKTIIHGDVEMYDNGSMKITSNQVNVDVKNLKNLIEDNLKYSSNKEEYLESAKILGSSKDKSKIKDAITKLKDMAKESGKSIALNGLSTIAQKALAEMLG